jgi:hypothetical protein
MSNQWLLFVSASNLRKYSSQSEDEGFKRSKLEVEVSVRLSGSHRTRSKICPNEETIPELGESVQIVEFQTDHSNY